MTQEAIAETLKGLNKGSFFTITSRHKAKVFKGVPDIVEKQSKYQGMVAVDYANRAAVKESVANGERDAPKLLTYVKESFIIHQTKFWRGHNGQVYLPVAVTGNKPQNQWYLNDKPCDYADVEALLHASEKPKKSKVNKDALAERGQVPFIGIKVEHIIKIN